MSYESSTRTGRLLTAALLLLAAGACRSTVAPGVPIHLDARALEMSAIQPLGTDSTLDVATWNLEWFGDPSNGPDDEDLQLENVRSLVAALELDFWSVQEIADAAHFATLLDRLDGYDGILANDPRVVHGPDYYNDFGGNELKVGLVYRTAAVTVDSARVILTEHDFAFAGRPPVELHLTVAEGDRGPLDLVVILIHAKAGAREADRERRATGAAALQSYLDEARGDRRVLVIGDFNDDVDTSIVQGQPTPYGAFVADTDHYLFPTAEISAAGGKSTVFYSEVIDHHLATDELAADYVPGTAPAFPTELYLDGYGETTSDHYPILARYAPWTAGGPTMAVDGPHRRVELTWTGAGTTPVYVFRNGARVAVGGEDGTYMDTLPVDGPTVVVYRVCDAALDRCSNDATVSF